MAGTGEFSDADLRQAIIRALRVLTVLTVLAAAVVLWKLGWRSALLLIVGAAISGSGLWEWLRVMSAVASRMDGGVKPRPVGAVLVGFFGRLALAIVILYVSLKFLDGSVFALAAGLVLGIVSLTYEALRLVKTWTA